MDEVAKYNQARWRALADADALFTRPKLELDIESARRLVDPDRQFGDLSGRDVLCLAGGGGQQSAAFALLGARVTVFDLSAEQLERDALVAEHYGFDLKIVEGDMYPDETAAPETWDHFVAYAPPWLCIRAFYRPDFKISRPK